MGGTIQTCRIAKMRRYKKSASRCKTLTMRGKRVVMSPPASPRNSTASGIVQQSQQQRDARLLPLIACRTFALSKLEQGCDQTDHPVFIGISPETVALYLEEDAKLQATDSPQPEREITQRITGTVPATMAQAVPAQGNSKI